MSFELYPDSARRTLPVPPGAPVFTAFTARSARVAELDPPYAQAMFVRLAMLSGSAVPTLLVAAGSGDPVEVSVDTQGVFKQAGGAGYVGDTWLKPLGGNNFQVTVGLVSPEPALPWRLGIRNTDTVDQLFTWVVADNEADTVQPWVATGTVDYPVAAKIPTASRTSQIAVVAAARRAYVTLGNSGQPNRAGLAIVDVDTLQVMRTLPAGINPAGVAVDLAGRTVYVTDADSNSVLIFDAETETQTGAVDLGILRWPLWLAVDAAANRVYAGNGSHPTISVIDATALALAETIDARGFGGLTYDTNARLIYACGISHENIGIVSVIDTATGQVLAVIPVGDTERQLIAGPTLEPRSASLYVADFGNGALLIIDTQSRAVVGSIAVGKEPIGVALDAATYTLYVTNTSDGTVSVIDTRSRTVRDTVAVGDQPFSVAIDPTTHTVYVTNARGNFISVIRPQR